jgi:hypothetical protein
MFDAYTRKDLDGFMSCWSSEARGFESRRKTMKQIFTETGPITLKELTIVRSTIQPAVATIRVSVDLAGLDEKSGKPHPMLGRLDRIVGLKQTSAGWRIVRYGPAEPDLAARLAVAGSREERDRLLAAEKDLCTRELVAVLIRNSSSRLSDGNRPAASRWAELACEAAERSGDADAAAEAGKARERARGEATREADAAAIRGIVQRVLDAYAAGNVDKAPH